MAKSSTKSRRKNLRRIIAKARKAGGGVLAPRKGIRPTGDIRVGGVRVTTPTDTARQAAREKPLSQQQREIAQKKVGTITRVVTSKEKNPITGRYEKIKTYVGVAGKKYSFPQAGLKFTARQKFGGIPSRELPIAPSKQKAIEQRLQKEFTKRVERTLERQEKAKPRQYFMGRVPEKEAKIKTHKS